MIKRLIERPVAVTMTLIAVLVLGFVSIGMLPVSLMPDIQIPQITVRVVDDNASARELDATIVKPLKNQLMQVSHLRDITTEARNGTGTIFMQFDPGSDINYLFIETNEKIDRAMSSLPRDMERPKVVKASATDIPAFFINMSLTDEDDDGVVASSRELFPVSPKFMELSRFAGQVIAKRIEQIPQVAMVDVSGLSYPELLIVPDRKKLESLGISEQTLENALQRNNIKLGNLTIREGEYQYDIRFESDILSKKDIENVYLNIHDRLYQFKDLATVIEHPQRRQGMVRSDSHNAVSMAVIKQSDAQMSDLRAEINGLMQHFRNEYPHVQFTVTRDQTQLLEYSIGNLRNDIIVGALLACLIIFLFMQDFRTPVLVTITIPLALIVSLLFFHLLGITINIVSLSGLVLGIGMMVDNSIVVIDNISQHWDRGEPAERSRAGRYERSLRADAELCADDLLGIRAVDFSQRDRRLAILRPGYGRCDRAVFVADGFGTRHSGLLLSLLSQKPFPPDEPLPGKTGCRGFPRRVRADTEVVFQTPAIRMDLVYRRFPGIVVRLYRDR